jgi:uncharacterized protein (DUF58 family)
MATEKNKAISRFLDPSTVSRLDSLELKARLIVEGFIAGMHRSPYHGFSVEFAEYRQYMQGDDVKHIDWKAHGKTDRFYMKVFEEETNLISTILLDKSGSMGFGSTSETAADGRRIDKLTYGSLLAASISYLLVRKHLWFLLNNLEQLTPGSETEISPALHYIAERVKRRGLIVLISDLMDDPEKVLMGLKHFRHRQHEVIVFHIMDPRALDLEYRDEVEFRDLETHRKLRVEPQFIKQQYVERVQEWTDKLNRGCRNHQIDYNLLTTETPFDHALTAFVAKRARLG